MADKTKHPFFATALDQTHEQINAFMKTDAGAAGMTTNLVMGTAVTIQDEPRLVRLSRKERRSHYKHAPDMHMSFAEQVAALIRIMSGMESTFREDCSDFLRYQGLNKL